jgi:hypothetical protein
VITKQHLFPDRFVKITKSVCFGDSGGPLFHEGTLVALNTWTFSYRCDGPNLEYRVDSAAARSFLDANLYGLPDSATRRRRNGDWRLKAVRAGRRSSRTGTWASPRGYRTSCC